VLDLIAAGLSNSMIADRLAIAHKTVGNHISVVFAKTPGGHPGRGDRPGQGSRPRPPL